MGLTPPSRLGAPKELLPKASKHVVNIWVPTIVPSSIHRCDFITSPRHMGPDTHIKRRSTKHSRKPHSLSYEAVGSSSCLPPRGGGPFATTPSVGTANLPSPSWPSCPASGRMWQGFGVRSICRIGLPRCFTMDCLPEIGIW